MKIKILSTGVVATISKSGKINIYTPSEWHQKWWTRVVYKYFGKVDKFDN